MVEAAGLQRVREGAHHVLLADERVEILGTVFAGEDLIGHAEFYRR